MTLMRSLPGAVMGMPPLIFGLPAMTVSTSSAKAVGSAPTRFKMAFKLLSDESRMALSMWMGSMTLA